MKGKRFSKKKKLNKQKAKKVILGVTIIIILSSGSIAYAINSYNSEKEVLTEEVQSKILYLSELDKAEVISKIETKVDENKNQETEKNNDINPEVSKKRVKL